MFRHAEPFFTVELPLTWEDERAGRSPQVLGHSLGHRRITQISALEQVTGGMGRRPPGGVIEGDCDSCGAAGLAASVACGSVSCGRAVSTPIACANFSA